MKKIILLLSVWLFAHLVVTANQGFYCNHYTASLAGRGADAIASPGHVELMKKYDVKFYFLDLDIRRTSPYTINGNVLIRAASLVNGLDSFGIELANQFTIDSIHASVNSGLFQNAGFTRTGTTSDIVVQLPVAANNGQTVEVRVFYRGNPPTSSTVPTGGGVFTGNNIFTASPPYNSSTWWPCKQSLTDKADSSWFYITTDTTNVAVANGALKNTVPVAGGKNRWEYKSRYPIDFYLVAFVIGAKATMAKTTQYFHPAGRTDSMIVESYGGVNVNKAVDVLHKFSDLFGLYPFYEEKLGLANVTLGGGMENQTIIAMGNIGTVMEHEITHQWFGDHVTCGSYRDMWLNEGFARWGESVYSEFASSNPDSARKKLCTEYEVGNPIYGATSGTTNNANANASIANYASDTNSINALYGGLGRTLNYEKPAMMLNSLRFEINNDNLFFLGLRNYLTQFGGSTARTADFINVMETTTGMDFTDFFNSWYFGYGFPTFSLKWHQKNGHLALQVNHTGSSANTPVFKTSLEVKVKHASGDTTVRVYINQNSQLFQVNVGDSVTGFEVDPNQWIANKTGTTELDTTLLIETAIENVDNNVPNYTVFPNPSSGTIFISSLNSNITGAEMRLYNSLGSLLHQEILSSSRQHIHLPSMPDGLYFIQIGKDKPQRLMLLH